MKAVDRWLLPDGVEEILPGEARKLEALRRNLLDTYECWGYELVIPPLIEFLDSLLVGSSHDLDIHTFKITDQLSGRMMGIRADITPQVARMDAHSLKREGAVRLCYADSVLHTRPRGLLTSRVPLRLGAELFGHSGEAADIELISLMHETLIVAGIERVQLVLGHVGIFRSLVQAAQLSTDDETLLFDALQRKAYEEVDGLLERLIAEDDLRLMLRELSRANGGEQVLADALSNFATAPAPVRSALTELDKIASGVKARLPGLKLGFDLCELRGYQYHTGVVFAAYTPGYGRAIAKGGRYDDIGEAYGRARPASGFDTDLKILARLSSLKVSDRACIFAPLDDDPALLQKIASLRAEGEKVLAGLDAGMTAEQIRDSGCNRQLKKQDGQWRVVKL
ncbi:MAG: ATP phosphoribosyltransferase regulatory subunit [Pseudomonadales bacterium]|nr:ATP phosphoribosyltransferase regulatory subunit [Pseudomonadales bacterium]